MAVSESDARAAAVEIVTNYAPGAPADVRTAAVAMLVDSMLDPPYENDVQFDDQQVSTHNLGPAHIRRSGAASLLAPWRRPRARVIEGASA